MFRSVALTIVITFPTDSVSSMNTLTGDGTNTGANSFLDTLILRVASVIVLG